MIPRIYAYLAGLIAILAVVGVIYGKGRIDARHAEEITHLKADLATAQAVIAQEKSARQQDAILATEAARRQASQNLKIDELSSYVDTLEDRNRECLAGADVERLRDLWK